MLLGEQGAHPDAMRDRLFQAAFLPCSCFIVSWPFFSRKRYTIPNVLNFIIQGGILRKRILFLGYRGVGPKHSEQHSLATRLFTLSQSQSDTSSCEV